LMLRAIMPSEMLRKRKPIPPDTKQASCLCR
jgi:hypothetical protein